MIFNICAMRGPGGPIFAIPVHDPLPIAVELLGQSEGDWPKEAYINWKCDQEASRNRLKKLFQKEEFDEAMKEYRTEIEKQVELRTDNDFMLKSGVLP